MHGTTRLLRPNSFRLGPSDKAPRTSQYQDRLWLATGVRDRWRSRPLTGRRAAERDDAHGGAAVTNQLSLKARMRILL